jgi:hypothetical protein
MMAPEKRLGFSQRPVIPRLRCAAPNLVVNRAQRSTVQMSGNQPRDRPVKFKNAKNWAMSQINRNVMEPKYSLYSFF